MATMKMAKKEEDEFNFTIVKQLTQQFKSFGVENVAVPLFQWRLEVYRENLEKKPVESDLFLINNSSSNLVVGKLHLKYTWSQITLSLNLMDVDNNETIKTLHPFQLFVCKLKLSYHYGKEMSEECFVTMDAFNLNADKNEFYFHNYNMNFDVATITVELHQEPLAMLEYRSPFKNMAVGKIEKMKEMKERALINKFISVSPRLTCGSTDQLIVVRFWFSKSLSTSKANGLSANVLFLNQSGPPFPFAVTFTIFSQQEEVKDSIIKIFYRRDENKKDFNTLLAFSSELGPYLQDDTLYYKVLIEPYPSKN